ncbi:MAG: hypothetical protein OXP09_12450 [Gammaproteobacteria bacterium]|nr:hypothetical protein [Gammaproteobacteria bacterium]MDE0366372.1 hypothetical protein [Gammaproteobacteria bacterium]
MRNNTSRLLLAMGMVLMLSACEPQDQRPGLWLSGELQSYPEDWSFTDEHLEIAIQVAAPYFLPHSITIICASFEGDLYVAAYRPETKNWPAWVTDDPNVVLKIGENLYEARLTRMEDPLAIADTLGAYARKYRQTGSIPTSVWFWRVDPRA